MAVRAGLYLSERPFPWFHPDRREGREEFCAPCEADGAQKAMGRTASCGDNATAESFFTTYKLIERA